MSKYFSERWPVGSSLFCLQERKSAFYQNKEKVCHLSAIVINTAPQNWSVDLSGDSDDGASYMNIILSY